MEVLGRPSPLGSRLLAARSTREPGKGGPLTIARLLSRHNPPFRPENCLPYL